MSLFSQRIGKTPIKSTIQNNGMDEDFRNALWNALIMLFDSLIKYDTLESNEGSSYTLVRRIWVNFFKNRLDEIPYSKDSYFNYLKKYFFKAEWYQVYDLIEFIPNNYEPGMYESRENIPTYINYCNHLLEKELSAFRFINDSLVQISNDEEIRSIEETLNIPDKYKTVKTHLTRALELFSDRKSPDYRNSIKESISAVESYCAILTNDPKATLGQALKKIEKEHTLHPALKNSFSSLYGYTSDAEGIRHALLEESNLEQEDAKFMLISCSAFINYLKQKDSRK